VTERAGSAEAFKALERAGWGAKVETYDCLIGQITARVVEPLLDAAGVVAGTDVLDVGTGPGYAAHRAAERGAVATGVDIADEVVVRARRRYGDVRFLRGDAEALPFPERSFDAVVGNFAINHLPQPEHAIEEFSRVVVPGGRIALSVWDTPERSRVLGIMVEALRQCGVTRSAREATGPDPHRFADDDEFCGLLRGAGLERVEVQSIKLTHRVSDTDELWRGMLGGSIRSAGLIARQPPGTRAAIRAAVDRLAAEYRGDGGLAIPADAKIASGERP
jgi:SAM-dependent methyltransferase